MRTRETAFSSSPCTVRTCGAQGYGFRGCRRQRGAYSTAAAREQPGRSYAAHAAVTSSQPCAGFTTAGPALTFPAWNWKPANSDPSYATVCGWGQFRGGRAWRGIACVVCVARGLHVGAACSRTQTGVRRRVAQRPAAHQFEAVRLLGARCGAGDLLLGQARGHALAAAAAPHRARGAARRHRRLRASAAARPRLQALTGYHWSCFNRLTVSRR